LTLGEQVHHLKSDVVPVASVLGPRVAEADDHRDGSAGRGLREVAFCK
jgi:hypothetical protein